MMVLSGSMYSASLKGKTHFTLLLPSDTQVLGDGSILFKQPPYKTIYLLHGLGGDDSDWLTHTTVSHLAKQKGLCVVLPSCQSSFYQGAWAEYVGKELVEVTRRSFPLSTKREETWVMGASMGGWGALNLASLYPETFGRCIALSVAPMGREIPHPVCPLYLGCGKEDPLLKENREIAKNLKAKLFLSPGGHDWAYWNTALKEVMATAR